MSLGLLNKDLRGPPSGSTRFETPETTVVRAQKVSESKVREAITYRHHLHNIKQFEASKGNKTSPDRCCVNTQPRPPVSMREELQHGGRTRRARLSSAPLHICSKAMSSYPTPVSQTITIHNIPISRVSLNLRWVEAKCSWWSCCVTYRELVYAFLEDIATTSSRLMNETRAFRGRTRGDITSTMNWSKST